MGKKHGEIVSVKGLKPGEIPGRKRAKIVGALEATETAPKTLDSHSPVEHPPVESKAHMDTVTVREHVRSKPLRKGEAEVRVRTMGRQEREDWNRVRRAEEE